MSQQVSGEIITQQVPERIITDQVCDELIRRAQQEVAFRDALARRPRETVEAVLGKKLPAYVTVHVEEGEDNEYYVLLPAELPPPARASWRDERPSNGYPKGRSEGIIKRAEEDLQFRQDLFATPIPTVEKFLKDNDPTFDPNLLEFSSQAKLEVVQETWDDLYLYVDVPPTSTSKALRLGRPHPTDPIPDPPKGGKTCEGSTNPCSCCG